MANTSYRAILFDLDGTLCPMELDEFLGGYFKDIKDFGNGIKRPSTIETDSPLYKGFKSVMLYSGLKKKDFPDEVFTQGFMSRMEELRK